MIFLTGDVHHMSMGGKDQGHLDCTEVEAALKYAHIASKYGIKATLFLTGKCCYEEREKVEALSTFDNIEIGGHTWDAFKYKAFHKLSEILAGSYCGPKIYQEWEVKKTTWIIKKTTGKECISWRGHCYRGDSINNLVLFKHGIKVISNDIDSAGKIKKTVQGLISVPINTLPDELNIQRPGVTRNEFPSQLVFIRNEEGFPVYRNARFSKDNIIIKNIIVAAANKCIARKRESQERRFLTTMQWFDRLKKDIQTNLKTYGYATVQAHPAIMHIADGFKTLKLLCRWLCKQERTSFARELLSTFDYYYK